MSRSRIIILAIVLVLLVGAIVICGSLLATPDLSIDPKLAKPAIPKEIASTLRTWVWIANSLRLLQIALGVIGTAAALTVTTFTTELGSMRTKICTLTAAFCLGTLTAFDIGGKADKTRQAWRQMTGAIMLYRYDSAYTLPKLIEAYEKAEDVIGGVTFREPASVTEKNNEQK